jgi:hypothetical protein
VLLKDALEAFRGDAGIPDPLGINDEHRAGGANAKAGRLRSHRVKRDLLKATLDVFPGNLSLRQCAAVWPEAEEKMAVGVSDPGLGQPGAELRRNVHSRKAA